MTKIVAIGAVAAGTSAAAKARRTDPDARVEIYTDENDISYAGCGFPHLVADEVSDASWLVARTPQKFREQDIEVYTRWRAERIEPEAKQVLFQDLEQGVHRRVGYDKLIIATGASSQMPPVQGRDLPGVFPLRTLADARHLREYVDKASPERAVIVGAGYIGIEMVEAFRNRGLAVTVVETAPHILSNLDADMAELVQDYLEQQGVTVLTREKVLSLEGASSSAAVDPGARVRAVSTDNRTLPADLVLMATGVKPNSDFAAEAGIATGTSGAIKVSPGMATNIPDIYAAGDCATSIHLVSGRETYIPLGTTANKQGKVAGANAAGDDLEHPGILGTGVARVMGYEFARTGLNERECKDLGQAYVTRTIRARTQAGYLPSSGPVHVKVLAEPGTNRLLGAQLVGSPGTGKRIDVFATALNLGAAIDQLQHLDLAYAPPFSPVYDPIILALGRF